MVGSESEPGIKSKVPELRPKWLVPKMLELKMSNTVLVSQMLAVEMLK